jgi:formate C-acetyltransferase
MTITIADFRPGTWTDTIDVQNFIQTNYTPYFGDGSFLKGPTDDTKCLWWAVLEMMKEERANGVLNAETKKPAGLLTYGPGYIDSRRERIVGLQTDQPLKRQIMPNGGYRVVESALDAYGYHLDPETREVYAHQRKTHNAGVFDAYTKEMLACRKSGIITGLPDAYGRGRIIGDYRRLPLYGADRLIADKKSQLRSLDGEVMNETVIRLREEIAEQIHALDDLKAMAQRYGRDISKPATSAEEAVQWLYFAYLGAVKEQDGAAMSLGRVSTFLDIYIRRDLMTGAITEEMAQEIIDQFVMKLRMVRFLRTPDYNDLFSGDPTWVTECIGGVGSDGRPLVTQTSFRFLQTLRNLGAAPEPNLTVLWSENLPDGFKGFCAQISEETSSVQYENDDLMRPTYGDDYGIACCVSAMQLGKQMQFFGARANLAKALLYAINGGRDEVTGEQVGPEFPPIEGDVLDYAEVVERFDAMTAWLAKTYVSTLNVIHYMHDKYNYERVQMAFHDRDVMRTLACGIAGLSVVADSLSAIKYAKVRVIRDGQGLAHDYLVEGEYPKFGNNDDRVDSIAVGLVTDFMAKLRSQPTYRNATPTQSVLTITSNVVYGKKTGNTPDGRHEGEPFAPGANPMHGRDCCGAVASLASVAKLPYESALDGVSYTFSIVPKALGRHDQDRTCNLVSLLDGFVHDGGHHVNVNVLNRETLVDAMNHPEKYPQLTIRVSGYAVNFVRLTREQQLDVIGRTFHERM